MFARARQTENNEMSLSVWSFPMGHRLFEKNNCYEIARSSREGMAAIEKILRMMNKIFSKVFWCFFFLSGKILQHVTALKRFWK